APRPDGPIATNDASGEARRAVPRAFPVSVDPHRRGCRIQAPRLARHDPSGHRVLRQAARTDDGGRAGRRGRRAGAPGAVLGDHRRLPRDARQPPRANRPAARAATGWGLGIGEVSQEQASGRTARYDDVADEYEQLMGTAANDPAPAALPQLPGAVGRRRVLDLPCGEGRVARELARRGAQVVGVDLSTAMLDKARAVEASEPLGIAYVQADATSPDALAGELFDAVVCNFGLSDIDDLDGAL